MSGMKTLIEELENQKAIVEKMSGYVTQAGKHPSPAEISAGIQTIPSTDLSLATATEEDVAIGKTFYSGNAIIKTGKTIVDPVMTQALFCPPMRKIIYEGEIDYTFPDNIQTLRKYSFYANYHTVNITFDNSIKTIEDYAFYETTDFNFVNFNELTNIEVLGVSCFQKSGGKGIDVSRLPNCIKDLKNSCFYDVPVYNPDYRFPDSLTSISDSIFRQSQRTLANSVDYSNFKLSLTGSYIFTNVAFNSALVFPNTVTSVGSYFNHDGTFTSITLPPSVKYISYYAFGSSSYNPNSYFHLTDVTIESETPPSISTNVFGLHHLANGFKIYVPDNSVEAYKAVKNLEYCADYIYPMSQKE